MVQAFPQTAWGKKFLTIPRGYGAEINLNQYLQGKCVRSNYCSYN